MGGRFSTNGILTGFAIAVKAIITLVSLGVIGWLLWITIIREADTTPPPYHVFTVKDASIPQRFVLPGDNRSHAVWLEYDIEGSVNGNAVVLFRTDRSLNDHIPITGMVRVHAKRDFFETGDVLVDYQPKGAKTGELVIKVRVL